jgi:hypothetical protein
MGLIQSFYFYFYVVNMFVCLFIVIVFFLFILFKLFELIKPSQVNDQSLNFFLFF